MSIWTNKPFAIMALVGLSACQGLMVPSRSISVLGMTVAAPAGYCLDTKASTQGGDSAVVLMGRCSAASNRAPALLTASIGAAGSDAALSHGAAALTSFFGSPDGLAMLSASGKAADVKLNAAQSEGDTLFLLISDQTTGTYWRAITGLRGRLLMLTAAGAGDVALNPDDGRDLLVKSLQALQKANGAQNPQAPKSIVQTTAAPTTAIPKSAIPESAIPESAIPKSAAPKPRPAATAG